MQTENRPKIEYLVDPYWSTEEAFVAVEIYYSKLQAFCSWVYKNSQYILILYTFVRALTNTIDTCCHRCSSIRVYLADHVYCYAYCGKYKERYLLFWR